MSTLQQKSATNDYATLSIKAKDSFEPCFSRGIFNVIRLQRVSPESYGIRSNTTFLTGGWITIKNIRSWEGYFSVIPLLYRKKKSLLMRNHKQWIPGLPINKICVFLRNQLHQDEKGFTVSCSTSMLKLGLNTREKKWEREAEILVRTNILTEL